jgi:ADP-ribose pyrophosphatase YjhB (NUDIX family)
MRGKLVRAFFSLRRQIWRVTQPLTLGCRVIALRGDQVVLVRLTYHDGWFLPGGGVDRGETFLDAAIREAREECGIEVRSPELLGVYLNRIEGKIDHVAVYVARDFEGEPRAADTLEIAEAKLFPLGALPEELKPGHRRRIEELLGGRLPQPTW